MSGLVVICGNYNKVGLYRYHEEEILLWEDIMHAQCTDKGFSSFVVYITL